MTPIPSIKLTPGNVPRVFKKEGFMALQRNDLPRGRSRALPYQDHIISQPEINPIVGLVGRMVGPIAGQ